MYAFFSFALTKCRWVQILSIQIGSRTAYIKSRKMFGCLFRALWDWQAPTINLSNVYIVMAEHKPEWTRDPLCSLWHILWALQGVCAGFWAKGSMVWLLVMTAPSVRPTGLLAHRWDRTMHEHGTVCSCRSALTEVAFSIAEEHRIPILLNFKRWKLLKWNRNVQPHKCITHQGWIHWWAFYLCVKFQSFDLKNK